MDTPFVTDEEHPACGVCPARRLPRCRFVVYDRPTRAAPFNAQDGYRYDAGDGVPVCVHPEKLGQGPDRFAPPAPAPAVEPVVVKRRRWWSLGVR
ncbi:hypothetical protein AB0O47_39565 [Streptomyces noursei]|uniref:hypothetical protein n=1 Tax=Streptomyces noursei TaxID=1971 RepID=UPI00344BD84C